MSEVGSATVSIIPTFKGFRSKVASEVTGASRSAGQTAGQGFTSAFDSGVNGVSGNLKNQVQDAGTQAGQVAGVSGQKTGSKFAAGVKSGMSGLASVGGMVAKSFLAAGAVVAGIAIKGGIERGLAIEDAKASLDGLGHSAETVTGIMSNASASVKGTAFGLGEAASTAAGAVAAGIKPGQDLERVLKLVADSATIAKTDMSSMGSIFNKVAASGKLQGDVIAQLQDSGVPVLQFVAKEIGATAEETAKLASDGKIDFETFSKAMENGLGGAAQKSGNTFRGAMKNTYAALGRIGETVTAPFLEVGKILFNVAMPALDALNDKLKPIMATVGTELTGGVRAFGAAWKANDGDITSSGFPGFMERLAYISHRAFGEIRGSIIAFGAAWRYNDGEVTSSGLPGFMERLAFVLRKVKDLATGFWAGYKLPPEVVAEYGDNLNPVLAFGARVRSVVDGVRAALSQLDFSSWAGFTASLSSAGGTMGSTVGPALASMGESLKTLAPAAGEFASQLPNIGGAVAQVAAAGLTVLTGVLSFLANNVDTIIRFMPVIIAGFIAWRVASMALASGTFAMQAAQLAMTPVVTLNNILRLTAIRLENQQTAASARNTIATVAGTTAENASALSRTRSALATQALALATGQYSIKTIALTVAQKAAAAGQWLLNAAMTANPIGLIIAGVAALIAIVVLLVKNWDKVSAFFSGLWEKIKAGAIAFFGFIKDLFLKYHPLGILISNWGAVVGFFAGLWDKVVDGAKAFGTGFLDFFKSLPGMLLDGLKAVGLGILKGLALGIALAVVGLHWYFTQLPQLILGWLAAAGSWLLETGAKLMRGLVSGITAAFQAVVAFFTALPGRILLFLVSAGQWLLATGVSLMRGLAAGITAGYQAVVAFFTALPGQVLAFLVTAGMWLLTTGINLLTGLHNGILAGFQAVVAFFAALPGWVLGFLAAAGSWLIGAGQNVINGMREGIVGAWNGVTGWLASVPGMVTGALSGAGSWLFDSGRNIIQGLLNGLKSLGGTIGSFFLDLLPGWIVGPFKSALGIHSPSRVFAGFGENIGQGVVVGAEKSKPSIQKSLRSLVEVPPVPSLRSSVGASVTPANGAGSAVAAAGVRVEQHIHPAEGMSESTIGQVAANSINAQLRRLG